MNQFIVQQKITPLVNRYEIFDASNGTKGAMISFVEQKRFAFKEEIQFYTDSTKQTLDFRVKAEKVMDIHGKFFVTASDGSVIGWLQKSFKASLLRSTWQLSSADQTLTVTEKSAAFAIFRRVWGFIPFIGDLPFVFKYHFIFQDSDGGIAAEYIKTTRLRDHYQLMPKDDAVLAQFDQKMLIAQCVILDALQDR